MTNITSLPITLGSAIQFYISTNADFRTAFQFVDLNKVPIDITGIKFKAQLRQTVGGTDVLLNLSTDDGTLVTDPQLGVVTFAVPRAKPTTGSTYHTSSLPPGTAYMDVVAIDGPIEINVCQQSGPATVTITRGITDPTI